MKDENKGIEKGVVKEQDKTNWMRISKLNV